MLVVVWMSSISNGIGGRSYPAVMSGILFDRNHLHTPIVVSEEPFSTRLNTHASVSFCLNPRLIKAFRNCLTVNVPFGFGEIPRKPQWEYT